MKSSIPPNQRKSFKKWALPVQRLSSDTTLMHRFVTTNKGKNGEFRKHVKLSDAIAERNNIEQRAWLLAQAVR